MGVTFYPSATAGSAVWGGITGTLSEQSDLDTALGEKADTSSLGDAAALDVGNTAGTVCAGDDARLSDARDPTFHTHELADITDAGDSASLDVGTTAGTVAAGDDSRFPTVYAPTTANLIDYWEPAVENVTVDGSNRISLLEGTTHDFAQATGENQPLWYASGANGFPYIVNDNSGRFLRCTSITQEIPYTGFLVIRQNVYAGGTAPIVQLGANASINQNGTSPAITFTDSATAEASTARHWLNRLRVVVFKALSTNPNEFIQTSLEQPGTNNGTSLSGINTSNHDIRCCYNSQVELYAYRLYSGAMSAADIITNVNYLINRFGAE